MKRNKTKYRTTTTTEVDYMKVIKIGIGVLIVLAIVYLVTAIASGEIKLNNKAKEKPATEIQYQEIMAGETFNRNSSEYYVLFMNFTDSFSSYYLSLISNYAYGNNSLPFYTVDMEKKINTEYITDELKIENPTILKISNSKTVETITGKENVLNFFKNN